MRVLLVMPWFRTLAHLLGEQLQRHGHDVTVITSSRHFEEPYHLVNEIVVDEWRDTIRASNLTRLGRSIRAADVVLSEQATNPVFWALANARRAQILTLHDFAPHDASHAVGRRQAFMRRAQLRRCMAIATFSEHVGKLATAYGRPVKPLPLTSEMPDAFAPRSAGMRKRHVLVMGRLSSYKNTSAVIEAFARVRLADEELHILGRGDEGIQLPAWARRIGTSFLMREFASRLSTYRAVIVPYSAASQSGVQVYAAQCGTASITSDLPGLLENQPNDDLVARLDDLVPSLQKCLTTIQSDGRSEAAGLAARNSYFANNSQTVVGAMLNRMIAT